MRRAFERAATTYDDAAVLQREVGDRMLERLDLVRLDPERVLDIGAGTGRATRKLRRRYRKGRVVALDLALAMLRQQRARLGWLRSPRSIPRLVCGDAEALPFAAASADLVFSNLVLQWCNDLDRTLAEFRRVLKPGGLAMFTTFGPDTLKELRASWAVADEQAVGRTHVNAFIDMHDIGDALLRAGFADPVMDVERIRLTYTDFAALAQELKLLGARNLTHGRPSGLTGKDRFARLRAAYEQFRDSQGRLPASFEVIYGHAWAPERRPVSLPGAGAETRIPLRQIKSRRG